MKNKTSSTIILVAIIAFISLAAHFSNQFFSLKEQQLKNEAVTNCLQSAGNQKITEKNLTTNYPLKDIYTFCMQDKGYTTSWK